MIAQEYIQHILQKRVFDAQCADATAFAPANIALCKYWGKRSLPLNLPCTESLSISLGDYGALTTLTTESEVDFFELNGKTILEDSPFYQQVFSFLNLFRGKQKHHFGVKSQLNLPPSAGLASSACGFAALILAMNKLFDWHLSEQQLSLLARLGSGSACRSLWQGFVHWQRGVLESGLDSYARVLPYSYPQMRIGLIVCESKPKHYSSREAMIETVTHSRLYKSWTMCVEQDIHAMMNAFEEGDLLKLFAVAERNARAMHATMLDLSVPIIYATDQTTAIIQKIWSLRSEGLPVYYTQDAGPNIKVLFEHEHQDILKNHFPLMIVINPFSPDLKYKRPYSLQ
jgi:diphosphomevalonate decarboxylase